KRYKNGKIYNYQYNTNYDMQFCAMELELPTKEVVVSFEGTDHTIAGWKEDAILSYKYPTESQVLAGIYLNEAIKNTKEKVIVCGHSKGGNLALTGSMRTNFFRKHRIKKIYSFDGPGLKESEFKSLAYKSVKKKLHNIIPDTSLVGVLFEQENLDVIKSNQKGLWQHSAVTWMIDNDKFIRTEQNRLSIELDKVINSWLKSYNYEERELIVDNFFHLLEEANITTLTEINLKSIFEMVRVSKSLDKKTKQVIFHGIRVLLGGIGSTFVNDEITKLKNKIFKEK
ncbi:MAG: Mbeg1-like protein, partial [Bacilli bacterium]